MPSNNVALGVRMETASLKLVFGVFFASFFVFSDSVPAATEVLVVENNDNFLNRTAKQFVCKFPIQ